MNNMKFSQCVTLLITVYAINVDGLVDEEIDLLIRKTKFGLVQGTMETTRTEKPVIAFYGIPYAKPPVGGLRFKPPEPVEPWTGVLKATTKPAPCYQQYSKNQRKHLQSSNQLLARPWTEDCLKLNIWVPDANDPEQPVNFYVHGGGFSTGSSTSDTNFIDSTTAVEARVVVVSVSYRLGAFGFLGLSHSEAPGNVGLMDQQLALKWVHENIEVFSGKRKAIFIVGEEAGGASAGYHLISKGSAGLFVLSGALQGSPNYPWAYEKPEESLKKGLTLADQLGCSNANKTVMIECLRTKHPEDIVTMSVGTECNSLYFKPTLDGIFLTEAPLDAIKSGRLNNATSGTATT